jgi:hypothetical protein
MNFSAHYLQILPIVHPGNWRFRAYSPAHSPMDIFGSHALAIRLCNLILDYEVMLKSKPESSGN